MLADPLRIVVDFCLPPRCGGCDTIVEADNRFCGTCWSELGFLTGAGCALCNVPLPLADGSICGPCLATPPTHDGVRAAVAYGSIARRLAVRLKYGRRTGLARTMAAAMVRHVDGDGLIIPVPLHRWRLWWRGFNQAQLIAAAVARRAGLSLTDDVLIRKRATGSMRGLSVRARTDVVRGAFRMRRKLNGETVWLVDDVYTSGATANACAATLKRNGAGRVIVLVWARVLRD